MDLAKPDIVPAQPRFVTGSIMRHMVVMSAAGGVGLIAIFVVDFLSLLYISWLRDPRLTAGVGFGTIVLFMAVAVNIGLMIGVGALVSRALGAGDREKARRLATAGVIHAGIAGLVLSLLSMPILPALLRLLGASEQTLPVAHSFLSIALPANCLMALGMSLSQLLRAVGDAKRGMYVTLTAAGVTALLDPLFIFGFGLGTNGAAIAIVFSRMILVGTGFYCVSRIHNLLAPPSLKELRTSIRPLYAIAIPAILTNIATPVANSFFASIIAKFGDQAIAAAAIIDRLVPVAFGGLFALSGAVGPIFGQNWGAKRFDRIRQILKDAVVLTAIYVACVWAILVLARGPLILAFQAEGLTAEMISFFCFISGLIWFFVGMLFVANAMFNNLGFPLYSTALNWGRATIGVIPFSYLGAHLYGVWGALIGSSVGTAFFGIGALAIAFWAIGKLQNRVALPLP